MTSSTETRPVRHAAGAPRLQSTSCGGHYIGTYTHLLHLYPALHSSPATAILARLLVVVCVSRSHWTGTRRAARRSGKMAPGSGWGSTTVTITTSHNRRPWSSHDGRHTRRASSASFYASNQRDSCMLALVPVRRHRIPLHKMAKKPCFAASMSPSVHASIPHHQHTHMISVTVQYISRLSTASLLTQLTLCAYLLPRTCPSQQRLLASR